MRINPINVAEITQAVVEVLTSDTRLHNVTIERSEDQNLSPEQCPWVGVYRLGTTYPIRQLGAGGSRRQEVRLLILVQATGGSGASCEDELEVLIVNVLSALLSDVTLRGRVQFLDEFDVNYTQYMRTTAGEFMQTAAIQFVAITNTTIGG